MIRLFIIEDHTAIIVAGFKRLFFPTRDGIDVVGYASSVEDTVETVDSVTFDIFILDLWLENKQPITNIRKLKKHFPGKPIIIYTSESSIVWKKRMLDENAMAYIIKSASRSEIRTAIETVAKGSAYYPVNLNELNAKKILVTIGQEERSITIIEKEILNLLTRGYNHKQIASMLGKSPSMLEKTLSALREHFKVKNNFELISLLQDKSNYE
jgi:DNA-binding NarL/FixJ family response regulator